MDNDIAVESVFPTVLEQVVELSILLTGEIYSDDLDDPSSFQFQTLSRQLAEKVCLVLPVTPTLTLSACVSQHNSIIESTTFALLSSFKPI